LCSSCSPSPASSRSAAEPETGGTLVLGLDQERRPSEGRDYLREAWWISTFPGLGIMLTVLGMNLLGDGLDPRL